MKYLLIVTLFIFSCQSEIISENYNAALFINDKMSAEETEIVFNKNYDSKSGVLNQLNIKVFNAKDVNPLDSNQCNAKSAELIYLSRNVLNVGKNYDEIIVSFINRSTQYNLIFSLEEFYAEIGFYMINLKEYDSASLYYSKSIEIAPSVERYRTNRGAAYYKLKDYEKALKDFQHVARRSPNKVSYKNLGICYTDLKEPDSANKYLTKSIKYDHSYSPAWAEKGRLFKKEERYNEAIEFYNQALAGLNKPDWIRLKAECFSEINKFDSANHLINYLLVKHPENGEIHYSKGKIMLKQQRNIDACQSFVIADSLGVKFAKKRLQEHCKDIL